MDGVAFEAFVEAMRPAASLLDTVSRTGSGVISRPVGPDRRRRGRSRQLRRKERGFNGISGADSAEESGCIAQRLSHPPLQPVGEGGGGFAQSEAVTFNGGEGRLCSEGLHLEALALEGVDGAGELPGVCDQQHRSAGVALAQPGGGEGDQSIGGGSLVAGHISRQGLTPAKAICGGFGGGGGDGRSASHQHHHRLGSGIAAGRRKNRGWQLGREPAAEQGGGGGAVEGAEGQRGEQRRCWQRWPRQLKRPGEGDHPSTSSRTSINASGADGHACHEREAAGSMATLAGGITVFGQRGEESPVADRWFQLDKCSPWKHASLDSIAESRAFSLLSCSVSFLSCFILCSCAIFRLSNSISLSS